MSCRFFIRRFPLNKNAAFHVGFPDGRALFQTPQSRIGPVVPPTEPIHKMLVRISKLFFRPFLIQPIKYAVAPNFNMDRLE
jgi:hypothetical protein